MKVLSLDLPWGSGEVRRKFLGVSWADLAQDRNEVFAESHPATDLALSHTIQRVGERLGRFDLILLDQPIGGVGEDGSKYRDVERTFTNSTFFQTGAGRVQCPKFQPGAPHAKSGLERAALCRGLVGTERCVVLESFPHLSIPSLVEHCGANQLPRGALLGLTRHKTGHDAQHAQAQLLSAFSHWTGRDVIGLDRIPSAAGRADALDAILALLPVLEWAAGSPRDEPWSQPVWLNNPVGPGSPLPSQYKSAEPKMHRRAGRVSPLQRKAVGPPGIRSDGLLGLNLPGWLPATGTERAL